MAIAQGFGKTVHKNLIFGYDTGDMDNSYRGAPGQNYAIGPNRSYSGPSTQNFENGKIFRSNGYTETVFIPTLGMRSVESVEVYNEYDGYGTNGNYNCCPTIFTYNPGGWNSFTWLPNTTYTYQIIYKSETGYTNSNYMYHYEYRADGSYITEFGVHTESQRTHLGDGWYHAWNTFTTNPQAAMGYCGCWHYEYYGRNKVSIAAVSIVPGTTIRPPRQFIDEGTTRSVTQGLFDLTGSAILNLSNVSFDSSAQLIFDGTDDTLDTGISITNLSALSNFSIECIAKIDSYPTAAPPNGYGSTIKCGVLVGAAYYSGAALYWYGNGSGNACTIYSYIRGADSYRTAGGFDLTPGKYHHLVLVNDYSSGTLKLYANGSLNGSATGPTQEYNSGLIGSAGTIGISKAQVDGGGTAVYSYFQGKIPAVKIYNKALSPTEVSQNYNHYKTRFNL